MPELPSAANEVWSMDFVTDVLADERRLRILTIVDDFTKEAIDIGVDCSIPGAYVVWPWEGAGDPN